MRKRIRISSDAAKRMKEYQQTIPVWRQVSVQKPEENPLPGKTEEEIKSSVSQDHEDLSETMVSGADTVSTPVKDFGEKEPDENSGNKEKNDQTDETPAEKDDTVQNSETAPVASRTDTGLVRPSNQDALILDGDTGLMGIADGMGGHNGGEVASVGARDLLCSFLKGKTPSENTLREGVKAANRRLFMRQQEEPELAGMGTTLTVLWPTDEEMIIGHVGDSRAYLLRDGKLRQLTADHSMVAEMVRQGLLTKAQAACHPMRNYITRAVGSESGIDVDIMTETRRNGDLWLVCSDGLYGMVAEVAIHSVLKTVKEKTDLEKAADVLLEAALKAGGKDNISLILYLDEGVDK